MADDSIATSATDVIPEKRKRQYSETDRAAWKAGREKKDAILGMSYGTAGNRLRKAVMFRLVQLAGLDDCHRCSEKILSVDELSIEHIEPWESSERPLEVFLDPENISFSHLTCNIAAASKPYKKWASNAERWKNSNAKYKVDDEARGRRNKTRQVLRARQRMIS